MSRFLFFGISGLAVFLFSCKKYQPAPDAFFIRNENVIVSPSATQGTSSHNITDYYLYVNRQFQGVYKIGSTMPIVNRGKDVSIELFAGIKNNGIQDRSIPWMLYEKIQIDTLVEAGKTITRNFNFTYNPNVTFVWLENFDNEQGTTLIKHTGVNSSDTTWKQASTQDSYDGKSIELGVTCGTGCKGILTSSQAFTLPYNNANIYLELNYKCNEVFEVGVTDGVTFRPSLYINPKDQWNKIYIQLAEMVNKTPVFAKYKVYFKIVQPNGNPQPRVWLDNIKLLYL